MKKYLILLLFQIVFLNVKAQSNYDSTSFVVSKGDLETNKYPQDSVANALVIYEYGNSYFDKKTFKLITEVKRKIKIFNKNKDDKATIEIYLYNNEKNRKEKIKDIIATTHNLLNENIAKTIVKKSEIFNEKYDKNYTIVKFTLPNIQDGSVITYSYTLESPFIYKYHGWKFQDDIPTLYSEYNTSILGNYEYNIKLVGSSELVKNESILKRNCLSTIIGGPADCINSTYVMKDIPAFIEEDYMTSKNNYLSRIEYELKVLYRFDGGKDDITKTWKTTDKELKIDESIGRQLNKLSLTKDLIDWSTTNENDPLIKAQSIYKFIQKNYTWNKRYSLFKDVSIKNLIKNKSGKASEINILLHNLLKVNGIKVKPILLSTRNNGFATKLFPVLSDFNYLIVQANINDKLYLLDATDDYLSFGEIPFKCLNSYGRLLDFKNGSVWVDIEAKKNSTIQHHVTLNLSKEGKLSGVINSRYLGYHALHEKRSYYSNASKHLEDFENKYVFLDVLEHTVKSKGKSDDRFQESFEIEINDLNTVGDAVYFDPFIFKFFTKNPFQLQHRTYPIDFGYKDSFIYLIDIELNNLYEVIETPKDINVKLPNNAGEFIFATKVTDNKINVFFKINFRQSVYNTEYYSYLKEFMSRIVDTQTKTLMVLKKK
jgi:hypothetical protein